MRQLSDNQLLHAYEDAVFYELDHNFIIMLREEINRRDLERAESRIIPKSMFKTNNT
ncbi:sporulation histidine kinase inhibitor Sda [Bacillus sp. AFS040349]|uniref:sporulation histidine kinase inhibitor Sda n=1 Tax=Bacillus sp. AFS040349 TaxID=2033502 RepID=UPI00114589A1|nr:sporulation histidine kinase inhibitor Sda [Bacillus sp. AFS040349]